MKLDLGSILAHAIGAYYQQPKLRRIRKALVKGILAGDIDSLQAMNKFASCYIHSPALDNQMPAQAICDTVCGQVGIALYDLAYAMRQDFYDVRIDGYSKILEPPALTVTVTRQKARAFWRKLLKAMN